MTVREAKKVETCDDLILSLIWRNPPVPGTPLRGITKEQALLTARLSQCG